MSTYRPDLELIGEEPPPRPEPRADVARRIGMRIPRDRTLPTVGALAAVRIGVGWVFLWAFLDKLFGLSYPTPSNHGWLDGRSPTTGFLESVSVGPFQEFFNSIAGHAWVDWTFMLGLAGIGVALVLGIALRPVAVGGTLLVLSLWCTQCPWVVEDSNGLATDSTNPFFDVHVLYALLFVLFAVARAGDAAGLGRRWSRLPVIRSHSWLQ